MQFDRHKVYPHPVLRPYSDDYMESEFQSTADFSIETKAIVVEIEYALSCEEMLSVIEQGNATFVSSISCRDTYVERVLISDQLYTSASYDIGEFRGEVTVNSFVIATKDFSDYESGDINFEFGKGPFSFKKGQVLAEEESQILFIERDMFKPVSSVFEWVQKDDQKDDVWTISFDNEHVQIQVSPKTKELIDIARNDKNNRIVLVNSIYFAAVMEAIYKIKDADTMDDYAERKWAQVVSRQAHNLGVDLKNDDSYYIAERLMKNPMSQMIHYIFGKST